MSKLTNRQALFVAEYLKDLNATQAAIRAGYAEKYADVQAHQLLQKTKVSEAIQREMDHRAARIQVSADRTLREWATLAFSDMRDFLKFQEDGDVVFDWSDLPKNATRAIQEVTVERYEDGKGEDARPVRRTKFRLHSKTVALEALSKHLRLYSDPDTPDSIAARLCSQSEEDIRATLQNVATRLRGLPPQDGDGNDI